MKAGWSEVDLADVAEQFQDGPFGSNLKSAHYVEKGVRIVRLQNIGVGSFLDKDAAFISEDHFAALSKHTCLPGDVLVATLGEPVIRACVQPDYLPVALNKADCMQLRCNPKAADPSFVAHYLNSEIFQAQASLLAHGQTRARINLAQLRRARIPLPSLPEQRRIAAILDAADMLRAKRRASLALLDSLTEAIFLDMFGDPVTNSRHWPVAQFVDLLSMGLRNGVSPSSRGSNAGQVLTLAAVTGPNFDAAAQKAGLFDNDPPPDKRVAVADFLICRGNGNPDLVGRGRAPRQSMPDTVFPDTIIAARLNTAVLAPEYLEHLWHTRAVRQQIDTLARTTNGTYKVNQTTIESVSVVLPPIEAQREYANLVQRAEVGQSRLRRHLGSLDGLFASLQHRAFRGEL